MNRFIYLSTVVIQALVSLTMLPLLTHSLDKASFGTIALISTAQQLATTFIALGVPSLISRSQVLKESTGHGFGTVLALLTIAGAVALPLSGQVETAILPLAAGNALISLSLARLRVIDKAIPWAILAVTAGPVAQTVSTGALLLGGGLTAYVATWVSVVLATTLLSVRWADRVWYQKPHRAEMSEMLRLGVPLSIAAAGMAVFSSGDRIMVAQIMGRAEAGQYSAFYTLGNFSFFATSALYTYWISRLLEGDRRSILRFRREVLALALFGAVAAVAGAFVLLPSSYAVEKDWPIAAIAALAAIPYARTLEYECLYIRTLNTKQLGITTPIVAVAAILVTLLVTWTTRNLLLVVLVTPVTFAVLAGILRLQARNLQIGQPASVSS